MVDGLKDFELSKKMLFYYLYHTPGVTITDELELAKSLNSTLLEIQCTYDLMQEDEQIKDFKVKKMLFLSILCSSGAKVIDGMELVKALDAALVDIQWTYDLVQEDEQPKIRKILINIKHWLHAYIDRVCRSVKQSRVADAIPFLGCNITNSKDDSQP